MSVLQSNCFPALISLLPQVPVEVAENSWWEVWHTQNLMTGSFAPLVQLRDQAPGTPGAPPGGWHVTPLHAVSLPMQKQVLLTGWLRSGGEGAHTFQNMNRKYLVTLLMRLQCANQGYRREEGAPRVLLGSQAASAPPSPRFLSLTSNRFTHGRFKPQSPTI